MIVKSKKAQVWIETVIYTLIGLILIAIVLAYATPKIQESQDNLLVGQSIDAMQVFAEKIDETAAAGIGTRSIVSLTIKKGELFIPDADGGITLNLAGIRKLYSEPNMKLKFDKVTVISTEGTKSHQVQILIKSPYLINFCNIDGCSINSKKFSAAAIPYRFSIEKALVDDADPNKGIKINIREVS